MTPERKAAEKAARKWMLDEAPGFIQIAMTSLYEITEKRIADLLERECAKARAHVEAAAGQMRMALQEYGHLHDKCAADGRCLACAKKNGALATDAGKGWVSPEAHAEVVRERDEARNQGTAREASRDNYKKIALEIAAKFEKALREK